MCSEGRGQCTDATGQVLRCGVPEEQHMFRTIHQRRIVQAEGQGLNGDNSPIAHKTGMRLRAEALILQAVKDMTRAKHSKVNAPYLAHF